MARIILNSSRAPGTWASTIEGDLRWLCQAPAFEACTGYDLEKWFNVIYENAAGFTNSMHKFCRLPYANICCQWAVGNALKSLTETFACPLCNKTFLGKQAYALHKFKSHGIKCIERLYLDTTFCPICLIEFHTRERALNHIRYRSSVCRVNLMMKPPALSPEQANRFDADASGQITVLRQARHRRHAVDVPCFRLVGPLPPVVIDPDCSSSHHA